MRARKRTFQPVNNDPRGDDTDDANSWRATTRLGANDCTAILVEEVQLQHLHRRNYGWRKLLALGNDGLWQGIDVEEENRYEIDDEELGLFGAGRAQ